MLIKAVSLLVIFSFVFCRVNAQHPGNYVVYANIIYRFTKYVDWPEDKKNGDFVIGIVGDTPLYDALKNFVVNKTAGTQHIVVKKLPANAGIFNCHILFIGEDESSSVRKIASRTAGTPTLLVTESEGLARKGSCINFTVVEDHLRLEINKTNIEEGNMSIASELLQLGVAVK